MKAAATALVLALALVAPALAQQRGGGPPGRSGGGPSGPRPAPAARPAPAFRPAPAAPVARPAAPARPPGGGFDVGNNFQRPSGGGDRPAPPPGGARPPGGRPPGGGYPSRPPRPPGGYPPPRPPRTVVVNPVYRGPSWGWNGGVVWSPAPGYWGGGFWGALAISAASAIVYGSIVNNNQTYYSYETAPGSPGAQLLTNYQLTQTNCEQPDLVVIYGPQNSVICAYPNNLIGPGNYSVDPSGLTITSM